MGLDDILRLVEETGIWPDHVLDAYMIMILKDGGNATPLGKYLQTGQLFDGVTFRIGLFSGFLSLSLVLAEAVVQWMLGTPQFQM